MKKNAIYYFSLAAILAGSFSSCREADLGFSAEEIAYAATQRDYTNNFIAKYGEIDPNHTWGFDSPAPLTRAADAHGYYKVNRTRIADNDVLGFEMMQGNNLTTENFPYYKSSLPAEVTEDEAKYVCQYIYNHPDEGYVTDLYTTYFIQTVAKVQHNYTSKDKDHVVEIGCEKMDFLWVDQEHNNDFNGQMCGWKFVPTIEDGNCTAMTTTGDYKPLESLVVVSATTSPSFKESLSSGGEILNHYKYYQIEYNGKVGTYLAFDFSAAEPNHPVDGDGHYDDWVVKITDAHRASNRVFCEDLGSIHDWDFNDLVFDYTIESGYIYIDILAESGTIPLGADFDSNIIGVHTPIGAASGHKYLPKEATILQSYKFASSETDIRNLNFWALHNSTTQWNSGYDNHDENVNARWQIRNTSGCAPYMIQVPTTVDWPNEEVNIGDKYPYFKVWVGNQGNGHTEWWK